MIKPRRCTIFGAFSLDLSRLEELDRNNFFVGSCKDAALGERGMSPSETTHADFIYQLKFFG
jgi:hypothetical protein